MTERTAHDAGVTACPFVAFVDDRDERADVPDHRHRCYAEIRPAQRALAHQEAFCLSAGFAACPTFQDWARREAARARGGGTAVRSADADLDEPRPDESAAAVEAIVAGGVIEDLDPAGDEGEPFDDRATRNPHRDWADPPPWSGGPGGEAPGAEPSAPAFLTAHPDPEPVEDLVAPAGLSASRWLQEVPPPRTPEDAPARIDDDELEQALAQDRAEREHAAAIAAGTVAATASSSRAARRSVPPSSPPPTVSSARRRPTGQVTGPDWERPRRFEAYPTLKTRIGLPSIPRVGLAFLAILVAAGLLFFVPFLLRGNDNGGGAGGTPSPSAGASASIAPSTKPVPTAQIYVVKPGDTLTKIAKKFGLTNDQILAANKQIKNPNKIAVGDEITIPAAAPSEVVNDASPAASASP